MTEIRALLLIVTSFVGKFHDWLTTLDPESACDLEVKRQACDSKFLGPTSG